DIDFAALLAEETDPAVAELHQYFSQRPPTLKNEYTGRFAGKNLLFITAEGFWKYAVNETYTPTLWKLAHGGFVFKNFYTPLWWKSTTDGEYTVCTSLI
ncbi:LTA synthase family protein, partial [Intestinimonas massiliensis]|nr:LTA synthase family protein [Intestinimonas massiliensis (ex Afouda et al. 2020)]